MRGITQTLLSQLTKNVKQAPGWVPLVVVCYLVFEMGGPDVSVLGVNLAEHGNFVVVAIAFFLYALGDAVDQAVWTFIEPVRLGASKERVREVLGIHNGIYNVSKALALEAGKYTGSWIQAKNEAAKFSRSLVLPCLVSAPVVLYIDFTSPWAWVLVVAGPAGALCYRELKASHIFDLYGVPSDLQIETAPTRGRMREEKEGDPDPTCSEALRYQVHDLPPNIRLFFWDGQFVASGVKDHKSRAA